MGTLTVAGDGCPRCKGRKVEVVWRGVLMGDVEIPCRRCHAEGVLHVVHHHAGGRIRA